MYYTSSDYSTTLYTIVYICFPVNDASSPDFWGFLCCLPEQTVDKQWRCRWFDTLLLVCDVTVMSYWKSELSKQRETDTTGWCHPTLTSSFSKGYLRHYTMPVSIQANFVTIDTLQFRYILCFLNVCTRVLSFVLLCCGSVLNNTMFSLYPYFVSFISLH